MPKAFSDREKQLVRERLLEEADRMFASHGFYKTSVEDLTRAVSISKGAFYLFYSSKEELFMEVLERFERQYRQRVLQELHKQPEEASPRSCLRHVISQAFSIWKTTPVLSYVSRSEYDRLMMKLPPAVIESHLDGDREFVRQFIEECRQMGIDIKIGPEILYGLFNSLFFVSLHEDDFGQDIFTGTIDVLVGLITSYCLGEVNL